MTIMKDVRRRVAAVLRDNLSDPWDDHVYHHLVVAEVAPYACVFTGPGVYDYNSEQLQNTERTVTIRLVAGPRTSGYDSERADDVDDVIEEVRDAFACDTEGQYLISTDASYTDPPTYLQVLGVSLVSDTGLIVLTQSGTQNEQLGVDFTLSVPLQHIVGGFE